MNDTQSKTNPRTAYQIVSVAVFLLIIGVYALVSGVLLAVNLF